MDLKIKGIVRKLYFLFYYRLYHKYKIRKTVTEKVGRYSFVVYPSVFNPKDYYSSPIFADFIRGLGDIAGKYVLDMGCGSGIVSVFTASKGAKCLAVDINPVSVKCTAENAKRNGFADNIKAIQSDLFNEIPGNLKFDVIFFNPPYYEKNPESDFEKAFFAGSGYRVMKDFLKQSKNYLQPGGFVYFIISSDLGLDKFKNMLLEYQFKFEVVETVPKFFETFYIIKASCN